MPCRCSAKVESQRPRQPRRTRQPRQTTRNKCKMRAGRMIFRGLIFLPPPKGDDPLQLTAEYLEEPPIPCNQRALQMLG